MSQYAIEGAGSSRPDVDIDALPYVDRDVDDESTKLTVERLIEQEMRRMKRKDRSELPLTVNLFEKNELLKQEMERIAKKQPLDALDTKRYELKGPEEDEDKESVETWKAAVDNAKSQLESQAGSMFNLELLSKYGANAWRVHNYQLETSINYVKKETERLRQQMMEINRERKQDQTQAAASLSSLENKWSDLISQNLQVELACAALENEVEELRRMKQ
ncbi:Pre-mRNA-splicing factor SPF27 [Mycotypha africana]|uniref:Pre-mRNA-splicing factor SPF27 n=1 Tax=Mycotypha africana TaxID=64632 RepID=UPI0023003498|nr:Pre-mRNA-splicing factor SPF27 [Mycotypha africana]KAI8973699.1 Pre-mRNA-splicing factor SPF27 [Mycotypha africana]